MNALYDEIGVGYDGTRAADPVIADRLAGLLQLDPRDHLFDLACGTGNYTTTLAGRCAQTTGIDASREMIASARAKSAPSLPVDWHVGLAEALPFPDARFDKAMCTLAIHHFPALAPAFGEVRRVLKPEGRRFVLFTSTPEQMRRYWLCDYFPRMMEASIAQMPARERVEDALHAAGFATIEAEPYSVTADIVDMFLYSGKQRPALYLEPGFRAGISSFANLGTVSEVEDGLARLARDIESGAVEARIEASEHDGGDYLFIVARD